MTDSRTVSISIRRSPGEVYDYLAEPANFPRWSVFITDISRDGDEWLASTPGGNVRIRFTPRNDYGIVDHYVTVGPALQIYVPLRVVANGEDGSEGALYRLPPPRHERGAVCRGSGDGGHRPGRAEAGS